MSASLSREQWLHSGEKIAVSLRGARREIFVRSSGRGEPLFFLHGFPTSSWDWYAVEPALSQDYRLVFFDFLGFGASDKPADHRYDVCEQADLAEAIARHFDLKRPSIVAHDYGVSVAQELLARREDAALTFDPVDVTFLNGGLYPDLHRALFVQKALQSPAGALVARLVNQRRTSAALSAVFAGEHQPTPEELAQHWASIEQGGGHRIGHRLIRYIDDRLANQARWTGALERANLSLRFVWGMRDPVSGAHVMERLHERFGGRAELIELADVGHYPQLEAPDRVVAAILR